MHISSVFSALNPQPSTYDSDYNKYYKFHYMLGDVDRIKYYV